MSTCSICLELIGKKYIKLNCGCKYHKQCLQQFINHEIHRGVLSIGIFCPQCRSQKLTIKPIPINIIYDLVFIYNLDKYQNSLFRPIKPNKPINNNYHKKCPTCFSLIYKEDGCNDTTCIRCMTQFCYQCLTKTLDCNCDIIS